MWGGGERILITDIRPKRKFISAVYINGEFAANIYTPTISDFGLKIGMKIDDETLHNLLEESNLRMAKEKALYLLSYKDHSKKELISKIKRTSGSRAAEDAVDRMEDLGLVNDESFAKKYAIDLINRKGFSAQRVEYELSKKGIERCLIEQILKEIPVDSNEQIKKLLSSKYRNKLQNDKDLKRTISALQRLGYNWEDIKIAVKEYVADGKFSD